MGHTPDHLDRALIATARSAAGHIVQRIDLALLTGEADKDRMRQHVTAAREAAGRVYLELLAMEANLAVSFQPTGR